MDDSDDQPSAPGGAGYWFTPVPIYLIEASIDPDSPVNGPAIVLWAHLHRHYAWRRRMFPAHSTLAKETGQSDSAVRRQLNALRDAGALAWGAKYSQKGRTSNDYALALQRPFEFDREIDSEVTVKNDSHPPVAVKNDGGVEVKNDRHPTVKNERVVEEHRVSEDSLSPCVPQQAQEPSAAPAERETTAQKAIRRTGLIERADEDTFIAWATRKFDIRQPGWWRSCADDIPEHAHTWLAQRAQPAAPKSSGERCTTCSTIAPVALTDRDKPYCAACVATCTSCHTTQPEDQLAHGECHPCRTARSSAA